MANPPGWNNKKGVPAPLHFASNKARVNLRPESFDELIKQQGVRVRVFRTILCPRVKSVDGGEHDIACPLCRSTQFVDSDPIETVAFISSIDLEKSGQPEGLLDHASAQATFLSGISLQFFTLIEVPDYSDTFYERVKRSITNVDVLKYKASQVNLIMDETGQKYYSGNDFNLDVNGNLQWNPGKGPEAGKIFSIHYTMVLQYRAIHAMHVNRFAQVAKDGKIQFLKLPEQWAIEKVFLADRRDYQGNPLAPNANRESDDS